MLILAQAALRFHVNQMLEWETNMEVLRYILFFSKYLWLYKSLTETSKRKLQ